MVDQRLRTFGLNMDVCLSFLSITHQELSEETGIAITKLKKLHTGEVPLGLEDLKTIADELNIPARYLTQTYPSNDRVARLRIVLEETNNIVSDLALSAPPLEVLKLPPTVRRAQKPAVLIVAGDPKPIAIPQVPGLVIAPTHVPAKELSVPEIIQPNIEPVTPDTLKSRPSKPSPVKKVKRKTASNQQVVGTVDPNFVMSFDGIDYNLQDKALKKAIVDRIRYLKGSLSYQELTNKLSQKRSYIWLTKLGNITPAEVVDIAKACGTTAKNLISGKDITPLFAGEKASDWLERYIEATGNKDALKDVANKVLQDLEVWPAPLRHMIVKYLAEIV